MSNSASTRSSSPRSRIDPVNSRRTRFARSGSSGVMSMVTIGRLVAARRVIRPWPISPPAPVTRTTGLRIDLPFYPARLVRWSGTAGLREERPRGDAGKHRGLLVPLATCVPQGPKPDLGTGSMLEKVGSVEVPIDLVPSMAAERQPSPGPLEALPRRVLEPEPQRDVHRRDPEVRIVMRGVFGPEPIFTYASAERPAHVPLHIVEASEPLQQLPRPVDQPLQLRCMFAVALPVFVWMDKVLT